MTSEPSAVDSVDAVELRLERRREQIRRDWEETRAYVVRKNRWTPLAVVAGAAALGLGFARSRPSVSAANGRVVTQRGVLAAAAALLGGVTRFALSPAGRALWNSWSRERGRAR